VNDRRIVICHTTGLRRIVGVISGSVAPANLPKELAGMVGGDMGSNQATLGAVEKRYVVYREVVPTTDTDGA
jgi:uncharacterized membrane protein